jgi:CheY-like chemotaxis protein
VPYYLHDGTKHLGPFEPAELKQRPGFGPNTLVYPVGATGADAWQPASRFPELFPPAAPPPPPPTPAATAAPALSEITLTMPAPRKREAPEPAPKPPEAAQPETPAQAAPAAADPATKKILIVDDDDGIREFIDMCVIKAGFKTVTAVDGRDALAQLGSHAVDLVVTDLMMPGIGGYEFLRALQAEVGRVPVFVVTASTLDDSTVSMIRQEANVVEFFKKPLKVPLFTAALHKHAKTAPR